jgi:hypothetical protein
MDTLYQPVYIYLLNINSTLLTDRIRVVVRIDQETMPMFLACTEHAGGT